MNLENKENHTVLNKIIDGKIPDKAEALRLMMLSDPAEISMLFSAARSVRKRWFGDEIFLYGFIYFSTYCRNSCSFCFYRKPNTHSPRYRKEKAEILDAAQLLEKQGVHLVDLTMGEDPLIHDRKEYGILTDTVKLLSDNLNVCIMISPGVVPRPFLRALAEGGVDWYAIYQETYNRKLFSSLRLNQNYDVRIQAKLDAKKEGLLIEEGILIGVGETEKDLVDSIFEMKRIGAHQVRAMRFVPQQGTPMEKNTASEIIEEIKTIAVLRLIHQNRLIPASLDIDGLNGLELRLMAGANVITSIIPPSLGLKGVAQAHLGVEEGLRSVDAIIPFLNRQGLRLASLRTYKEWIDEEKNHLGKEHPS